MQLQSSLSKRSSQSAEFELGTGWGDGSSSGSLTVTWVDTTGNFLFNLNTIEKGDFFHHFILCWFWLLQVCICSNLSSMSDRFSGSSNAFWFSIKE